MHHSTNNTSPTGIFLLELSLVVISTCHLWSSGPVIRGRLGLPFVMFWTCHPWIRDHIDMPHVIVWTCELLGPWSSGHLTLEPLDPSLQNTSSSRLTKVQSIMVSDDVHSFSAKSDLMVTRARVVTCRINSIWQELPTFQHSFRYQIC